VTDQQLKQTLRDRGLRVTPQRILIHRALAELGRHSTAEEVLERVAPRLPNASLPTVYATLELLEELGIAWRIAASSGATLWDPRPERHHHLVCRSCGAVEDLDVKVDVANPFRAARRRGFRPDGAELVVSGLCERCQTDPHGPDAREHR
jgi:Fur family peroxide stress response transcriptional regulator